MTVVIEVVIFTHNHEDFIEQSLKSVIEQEHTYKLKIRVHDDFSSDSTVSKARTILENSGLDFRIFESTHNKFESGISFFHEFIAESEAEFVAILDGDDYWTDKQKLSTQVEALLACPAAALSHHKVFEVQNEKLKSIDWPPLWATEEFIEGNLLSKMNVVSTSSVLLRMNNFPKIMPGNFNSLRIGDYPMWALTTEDKMIHFISREMAGYRIHSNNIFAKLNNSEMFDRELEARIYISNNVKSANRKLWREGIYTAIRYLARSEMQLEVDELNQIVSSQSLALENTKTEINDLKSKINQKLPSQISSGKKLLKRLFNFYS